MCNSAGVHAAKGRPPVVLSHFRFQRSSDTQRSFSASGLIVVVYFSSFTLCFGFKSLQAALPDLPPLPSGTGVAGYLCTEASSAPEEEGLRAKPPLVVLLRFCGEGNNTPEAIEVAQAVNASLGLLPGGDTEGASPI